MELRAQRVEDRRRAILDAARERADAQGWAAVTTRHLAAAIGFSQPVLYGHFPGGKADIVLAVALEGFLELTRDCRAVLGAGRLEEVAAAYLDFGRDHPAVYEAMFHEVIAATFASEDTPAELRAGFEVLREAVGDDGDGSTTEVFWAALHGIHQLERAGRVRPEHRPQRIAELAARFTP